jgi:type VI secretion system protein ImpE
MRDGKLGEAIASLSAELRDNPTDGQRRTFLFELLCFAGEYDRAEKQLDVLARSGKEAEMGALLYHSALHAERTRQDMFRSEDFPHGGGAGGPAPVSGTLNGRPVSSLTDADPRIGARLEVYAAGQYTWIPFEQLATIRMKPPERLRDTLWAPAVVRTSPSFKGMDLGEVLVPVVSPLTADYDDEPAMLGRVTEWVAGPGGAPVPLGQKVWLVDGEEIPILEVRELDVAPPADASA